MNLARVTRDLNEFLSPLYELEPQVHLWFGTERHVTT